TGSPAPPHTPLVEPATPQAVAPPAPTPTAMPPTPSPPPRPTLTPVPPTSTPPPATATPVPPLPMRISALLDPPTPRAGEDFVLALSVMNDGDRPARGIYVATNGPWDRWTVLGIEPSGTFSGDSSGWHLISDEEVPAGETRTVLVHIRADEPAQEQLTF